MSTPALPTIADAQPLLAAADTLLAGALARAREITKKGAAIDDHQVLAERVAYAATEARAARELLERGAGREERRPRRRAGSRPPRRPAPPTWSRVSSRGSTPASTIWGSATTALRSGLSRRAAREAPRRRRTRRCSAPSAAKSRQRRGRNDWPLDETLEQVRASVREFAEKEIAPHAEHIHRHDETIPEEFIEKMAELGYFGLSMPEEYGGDEMGNLAMILTTEELSRASLAAAGSLITRPEILTKALMAGGTEEQKKHWLPKIAAGELMVGISVTEPDIGSRRRGREVPRGPRDRRRRRRLGHRTARSRGAPSRAAPTCSRCSRAPIPTSSKGPKGLSLFIVAKEPHRGHAFECTQPGGGKHQSARPTRRPATAACTPSRCSSRTGSCPRRTWSAATPASARASICRWAASPRGASRPAVAPAASRRRRSRRPASTSSTASSSASRSSSSGSRST